MKTKQRLPWLMMMFIGLFPLLGVAQSYDQLWKEVEMYQKKDLPKSVIAGRFMQKRRQNATCLS